MISGPKSHFLVYGNKSLVGDGLIWVGGNNFWWGFFFFTRG